LKNGDAMDELAHRYNQRAHGFMKPSTKSSLMGAPSHWSLLQLANQMMLNTDKDRGV
jgi:hypothetical protein